MKEVFFTAAIMGIVTFAFGALLFLFFRGVYSVITDWQLERELKALHREAAERRKHSPRERRPSQSLSDLTATEQTIASEAAETPNQALIFDLPDGLTFNSPAPEATARSSAELKAAAETAAESVVGSETQQEDRQTEADAEQQVKDVQAAPDPALAGGDLADDEEPAPASLVEPVEANQDAEDSSELNVADVVSESDAEAVEVDEEVPAAASEPLEDDQDAEDSSELTVADQVSASDADVIDEAEVVGDPAVAADETAVEPNNETEEEEFVDAADIEVEEDGDVAEADLLSDHCDGEVVDSDADGPVQDVEQEDEDDDDEEMEIEVEDDELDSDDALEDATAQDGHSDDEPQEEVENVEYEYEEEMEVEVEDEDEFDEEDAEEDAEEDIEVEVDEEELEVAAETDDGSPDTDAESLEADDEVADEPALADGDDVPGPSQLNQGLDVTDLPDDADDGLRSDDST